FAGRISGNFPGLAFFSLLFQGDIIAGFIGGHFRCISTEDSYMAKYKNPEDYCGEFLTVDLRVQVSGDPFARTLSEIIDEMDLSAFDANYHNDEAGAAAIPPALLLKVVLYCYSKGILSSRKMAAALRELIIVKALAFDKIRQSRYTAGACVTNVLATNHFY
ncbi:MAG: transposase, partial [Spirochaetaceae bacterium]|nr:transposase [Spirochaetaceae bacterium]